MDRRFEIGIPNGESEGPPSDLLTDPAKYDTDIPLWRRTLGFIRQYGTTRPNKRQVFLDQFAVPLIRTPFQLEVLIDNLNLAAQCMQNVGVNQMKEELVSRVEVGVARRGQLAGWTPERIGQLVGLGLDTSGEFKTVAERMEAALFNAPKTIEEAVDLFYNAAWAMVETTEPDIREELYSILCLEKPWLTEEAESVMYRELGMLAADDVHLSRFHAFHTALEAAGRLVEMDKLYNPSVGNPDFMNPKRANNRNERCLETDRRNPDRMRAKKQAAIDKLVLRNPRRFQKLVETIDSPSFIDSETDIAYGDDEVTPWEAGYRKLQEIKSRPWPENVIKNSDDPLNKLVWEYLHRFIFRAFWEQQKADYLRKGYQRVNNNPLDLADSLMLDIIAKDCQTAEQKAAIIRLVYSDFASVTTLDQPATKGKTEKLKTPKCTPESVSLYSGSSHIFDKTQNILFAILVAEPNEAVGQLSSILEYHRPLLTTEQVKALEIQAGRLRKDINQRFVRSVGRRGYSLVISDPFLRRLGYNRLTIKQNSSQKHGLIIDMGIDQEVYTLNLDASYRVIPGRDVRKFVSGADHAWLEVFVLSHLRKLVCTGEEEEELRNELVGGSRQYERYRKQHGRREHLRKQVPGKGYSTRAFELCLKSNFDIKNLQRINQMRAKIDRGGTKETGIWTYVSGSEYTDTPDAKPIKVAFKSAAEDLRKVIPLGQISPEEMTRIENEILGELEKN